MALQHHVLSLGDADVVYEFANKRLHAHYSDETERAFASWSVRWRKEALEHYLKLGWSFIARDEATKEAKGFFLGQPLLFFRGQTQTLWIEHLEADSQEVTETLLEIAVKLSREKHLQRVLFSEATQFLPLLQKFNPVQLTEAIIEVKTTKG